MLEIGRLLVIVGCTLLILGLVLTFAGRVPGLGRLPGDIVYRRGNFTLATSIVLSLVLTAVLWVFRR